MMKKILLLAILVSAIVSSCSSSRRVAQTPEMIRLTVTHVQPDGTTLARSRWMVYEGKLDTILKRGAVIYLQFCPDTCKNKFKRIL